MAQEGQNSSGNLPSWKKRKDHPQSSNNSRQNSRGDVAGGRAVKRTKTHDMRRIEHQPASSAFSGGEVDLDSFLKSREFEIAALEDSMQKSKAAGSRRAFQLVPREMRRRTASHNVKRLPKRLRDRARREQIADNTPTVEARKRRPRTTRARIRAETAKKLDILARRQRNQRLKTAAAKSTKSDQMELDGCKITKTSRPNQPKIRQNLLNDPPKTRSRFAKRQKDKVWLPTHLWHAKRAKMSTLWDMAIPMSPTNKSHRATHRAAREKGMVCWDTSYIATIRLHGLESDIDKLLEISPRPNQKSGYWNRWKRGSRVRAGNLRMHAATGPQDMGPATAIYNPIESQPGSTDTIRREALLRVHPAAFQNVWDGFLIRIKSEKLKVTLEDLRWEIGSIDLVGPASTEVLQAILRPHSATELEEFHAECFKAIGGATSLSKDVLLSFSVQDPRLQYPPKTYRDPALEDSYLMMEQMSRAMVWAGDKTVRPSRLFDRKARYEASCLPSQGTLNRRKGSQLPGTQLEVTAKDPSIPIVLQFTEPASWTVLAPRKCILPFWYSLMHYPLSTGGNPRFGGLDELRQVTLENGQSWFPGDYPGSTAGLRWEVEQRMAREREWRRRPTGKRVAWESLDLGAGRKGEIGSGFACDWEFLLGLPPHDLGGVAENVEQHQQELGKGPDAMYKPGDEGNSLRLVTRETFRTFIELGRLPSPVSLPKNSLLTVSITMISRGDPRPCARIYRLPSALTSRVPGTQTEVPATEPSGSQVSTLPTNLRRHWLALVPKKRKREQQPNAHQISGIPQPRHIPEGTEFEARRKLVAESLLATQLPYPPPRGNKTNMGGHPLVPNEEDLIGFVTSGHFNLARGKGTAIGHLSSEKAVDCILRSGKPKNCEENRLCVIRNAGESVGWLAKWELVG